jgi:O-antigen ligase
LVRFPRLCGSGIYHDPNDFCLLLSAGILLAANRLLTSDGLLRVLWLLPIGFFAYAVTLTKSRGGLMAVMAGLGGYCAARYGLRRSAPLAVVAVAGLMAMGGRSTNIDLADGSGTAQERIQKWSEGFALIPSRPVFGIGAGEYENECGLVAHNSYVHAYVELGLFGGGLFLSAFLLGLYAVATVRPDPAAADADALDALRPALVGMVLSYMVGMYSLSRAYIVPTYLTLALVTVYLRLAAPWGVAGLAIDRRLIARMCGVAILGYVGLRAFIYVFVRYG